MKKKKTNYGRVCGNWGKKKHTNKKQKKKQHIKYNKYKHHTKKRKTTTTETNINKLKTKIQRK